MLIQTESKAQGWRAVAVFDDRPDALIFVGRSSTQVRQEYVAAYLEFSTRRNANTSRLSSFSSGAVRRTPAAGCSRTR